MHEPTGVKLGFVQRRARMSGKGCSLGTPTNLRTEQRRCSPRTQSTVPSAPELLRFEPLSFTRRRGDRRVTEVIDPSASSAIL